MLFFLGELLRDFFKYYHVTFDFTRDVGSVRTGTVLSNRSCYDYAKSNSLSPKQWEAYMCMEEPFDRTNAGRAVIKRPEFDTILKAFKAAHELIQGNGDFERLIREE